MIYRLHTPAPPLSRFIEHFFYYDGYASEHVMEKFLPDGSMDLLIDLTEGPKKLFHDEAGTSYTTFKKSWISGMKTEFILIDASVTTMIGVHFKPGGCYPFVKFPISELNDLTVDSQLVWGSGIMGLRDQILETGTIPGKFALLEDYFLTTGAGKLDDNPLLLFSVNQLVQSPTEWTIRRLSEKTGISQKHLITLFRKFVGLPPKSFSRIIKFQRVIQAIERQRKIEWTSLAYECGYYDQSHFIKEFKAFSGINPAAYLEKRGPYINYLPIS